MTATREQRIALAEDIIRSEGALSWVGLRDPDLLGCSAEEHEDWLATETEDEIRAWARSVAQDEERRQVRLPLRRSDRRAAEEVR